MDMMFHSSLLRIPQAPTPTPTPSFVYDHHTHTAPSILTSSSEVGSESCGCATVRIAFCFQLSFFEGILNSIVNMLFAMLNQCNKVAARESFSSAPWPSQSWQHVFFQRSNAVLEPHDSASRLSVASAWQRGQAVASGPASPAIQWPDLGIWLAAMCFFLPLSRLTAAELLLPCVDLCLSHPGYTDTNTIHTYC